MVTLIADVRPATHDPAAGPAAVDAARIARAKVAYSVRRVDLDRRLTLQRGRAPRHGDLVLAEIVSIGQHTKLELTTSRRATLYPGDEIVVAFGARYAPDQFEAELPADLDECDLVAAGGCAARVLHRHSAMKEPTRIRPVGLLAAGGTVLNVADGALAPATPHRLRHVPTILVAGTSMNAGKTTAVASLVHGLTAAGLRVGAGKFTGTGAGGDRHSFADAGAAEVLDFTDLGLVSTFRVPVPRLAQLAADMHTHLASRGVDVIVLEIADGVLHHETGDLLRHPAVLSRVDGAVFAAGDAVGALLGVERMRACGQRVLAVSGLVSASPMALREARSGLDVPVLSAPELCDPEVAGQLLGSLVEPVAPRFPRPVSVAPASSTPATVAPTTAPRSGTPASVPSATGTAGHAAPASAAPTPAPAVTGTSTHRAAGSVAVAPAPAPAATSTAAHAAARPVAVRPTRVPAATSTATHAAAGPAAVAGS